MSEPPAKYPPSAPSPECVGQEADAEPLASTVDGLTSVGAGTGEGRINASSLWRRNWGRWELTLLLVLAPLVTLSGVLLGERLHHRGHVMPGVVVAGRSVEGWSREALQEWLDSEVEILGQRVLHLRVGNVVHPLKLAEVDLALDVAGAVAEALSAGREGGLWAQLSWRLRSLGGAAALKLTASFDESRWHKKLQEYAEASLSLPVEGGMRVEKNTIAPVYPRPGQQLPARSATKQLQRLLQAPLQMDASPYLALTAVDRSPSTTREAVDQVVLQAQGVVSGALKLRVSLEALKEEDREELLKRQKGSNSEERVSGRKLRALLRVSQHTEDPSKLELNLDLKGLEGVLKPIKQHWEREAVNATFQVQRGHRLSLVPGKVQLRFSSAEAAQALLEAAQAPGRRGVLRLAEGNAPRVTTEAAEAAGITGLVGEFVTHHPCCRPRVKNIHRIAELVDGTVVLPGETFSVNELVGPRTSKRGFFPAPTIVHGEIRDTLGGGVSQFATTLFNAVFNGGYDIIERQPHSFYFRRYPVGHEATLSFPKPDLIFRNDTNAGVLIKTQYGPRHIRVRLYGNNGGRKVRRNVSKRFDLVEPEVEYEVDDELPPEKEKVLARGQTGFSVWVSRTITSSEGQESKQRRKVTYKPRVRRLALHSCNIPEGEEEYTGEPCPEPEVDAGVPEP